MWLTTTQFIGSKVHWRLLDPIGGMVLSAYIIIEWLKTLLQNFANRKTPPAHYCTSFPTSFGSVWTSRICRPTHTGVVSRYEVQSSLGDW